MKIYNIGGDQFTLAPLTWRQKKLSTPFEQKVREQLIKIAGTPGKANAVSDKVADLYKITIDIDSLLYGDDALLQFLGIILSNVENGKVVVWSEKSIEENKKTLEKVTEDQIGEIFSDFFMRAKKQLDGSTLSSLLSSTSKSQSIES